MRIFLNAFIIVTLLGMGIPQNIYSYSEEHKPKSLVFSSKQIGPDLAPLSFPGQDAAVTIYFPLIVDQNLHPREKITLSIFASSKALESVEAYEKNVDSNGIPILVEGFTNGDGYHPSYICRYALYIATAYDANHSDENYRKIQNIMTWIKDNRVDRNTYITWEFNQDLPLFDLKAPWTSALTNAWCAGALLQGYKVTGDVELESLARSALEYLFTPLSEGGGLYEFDNGDIWFEESPNLENPSHILNGFIFAIDILDMFNSYYAYDRYQEFLDRAIISLVNRIDQYDVDYGSIYDLYYRGNKIGSDYHFVHYVQLYYLYLRTGNLHLLELSQKWYALTYQNRYELLDSAGTSSNLSIVNDGIYWYNYVLVRLPKEFSFNFGRAYELHAVNFFLYRDNNPTPSMSISYRAENGTYIVVPTTNYTIELKGSNNTNGHITNVYTLSFNQPITTQSLKIKFEKTTSNDVGVFREVGILKNMNDEYQIDTNKLPEYVEIINKRKQLLQ